MTEVYGCSDDLIQFEGDFQGEVGHYSDKPCRVTMSDGTVLKVVYAKDGVWRIEVVTQGSLYDRKTEGFSADAPRYSDTIYFKAGIIGAKAKGKVVR